MPVAAPGTTTGWINGSISKNTKGELELKAPAGTTIVEARGEGVGNGSTITGQVSSDGQSALFKGDNTWADDYRKIQLKLRVNDDAAADTTLNGGTATIKTAGTDTVVGEGSFAAKTGSKVAFDVPATPAGQTTDWISGTMSSSASRQGDVTLHAPAGTKFAAVRGGGGKGSFVNGTVSADGTTATIEKDNTFSNSFRKIQFKLQILDDQKAGDTLTGGTADIITSDTKQIVAHGTFSAIVAVQNGGVTAAASDSTALVRGGTVDVPFSTEATTKYTELKASVELTAPSGTTFAAGSTLKGQWRKNNSEAWRDSDSLALSVTKVDGDKLTGTFDSSSSYFVQEQGYQLRWLAPVKADDKTPDGAGALGYKITGSTNHGAVAIDATSPVSTPVSRSTITFADVPVAAPGTTTGWIDGSISKNTKGELELKAPAGTKIVEARGEGVGNGSTITGQVSSDGQSALFKGDNTWADDYRKIQLKLRVNDDAAADTTLNGGTATIKTAGTDTVVGEGSFSAKTGSKVAFDVPATPAGQTTDWVSGTMSSSASRQGEVTLHAPAGTKFAAVRGGDGNGSTVGGTVSADGTTATISGDNTWSNTYRKIQFKLQILDDQKAGDTLTGGTVDVIPAKTDQVIAHGTISATVAEPVIENGGIASTALGFDTEVQVGEQQDVFAGLEATADLTSLTGTTFEVTAPAGTKFVAGTAKAQTSADGSTWQTDSRSSATVQVKDDGAKATVTVSTAAGWTLAKGTKTRWSLPIEGVTPGTGAATFTVSGSSDHGAFTASGSSSVTVTKPAGVSRPFSVQSPEDNSATANRTPYFMGWGTAESTVRIQDGVGGPEIGSTTVDDNGWWGKVSTATLRDGVHTFVITQTKPGGETETITRTVTIDSIRDLTIDSPVDGSTAWYPNPALIGWGTPGGHVTITDENDNVLGSEDINSEGWFGVTSAKALANGQHTLTFTQTANGATNTKTVSITIAHKPFQIDSPQDGGSSWWPNPSYIGWATPGAWVDVFDTDGTTRLAHVQANDDGWFGIVSEKALSYDTHTLHFRQTFNDATTETSVQYTIAADPLRIEAPTDGYTNWWPKPSFIGWATPGAQVRITDTDGSEITTVTANGEGWFGEISPKDLTVGEHTITFTQLLNDRPVGEQQTRTITITEN
ncbi:Ig-like domain-containing protein [Curtobacterium sp. 20TX0008]|uniref:Ig-like domain-containing protein n=1 Tax=Curtobacterium sp. 20TX0008 TaxID=3022018 RepID=UPI0023315400|nr:Ig-like domain-containing protein [Curtobacterium sp. 20TX0008]MDB6428334.1 Ig-like domain-containing protein [Curtobacterium sp. 20TX0008]